MPRRSAHGNSDDSPVTRRTSARIAAAQAASPAKSPAKSPRRKRQSTEPAKIISDDTESQQSAIKSEVSMEELNGVETSSSTKDRESLNDSLEIPAKKTKVDDSEEVMETSEKVDQSETAAEEIPEQSHAEVKEQHEPPNDFEVVEHTSVPPPDSVEVQAAISAQGDDGQLLVDFVQVDRDEIPAANSVEVKQITDALEAETQIIKPCDDSNSPEIVEEVPVNSLNCNDVPQAPLEAEEPKTNGSVEIDIQQKVIPLEEPSAQPIAPAAGDTLPDVIAPELVSQ